MLTKATNTICRHRELYSTQKVSIVPPLPQDPVDPVTVCLDYKQNLPSKVTPDLEALIPHLLCYIPQTCFGLNSFHVDIDKCVFRFLSVSFFKRICVDSPRRFTERSQHVFRRATLMYVYLVHIIFLLNSSLVVGHHQHAGFTAGLCAP